MKKDHINNMKNIFAQVRRPLACFLVLCLIITFIPMMPKVELVENVFAESPSSGTVDITSDKEWVSGSVNDETVITIQQGNTLTLTGNLTVNGNLTITGGGVLKTSGASIVLSGTSSQVLNINNIEIKGSQQSRAIFYWDTGAGKQEKLLLNDVNISDANCTNVNHASVILANNNVTVSVVNVTISDISGGKGAIYLYEDGASLEVDGNVVVSNSESSISAGGIVFRAANTTGKIKVKGVLGEASNIAVLKENAQNTPIQCDNNSYVNSAIDAFYVCDDFDTYGFAPSGTDLQFANKTAFTTTYTGDTTGSIDIVDKHGRSIVTNDNGSDTITAKEISGREVTMYMTPASTYFVKGVTIGAANKTDVLIPCGVNSKKITFAAVTAGAPNVVFERAITSVDISGVIQPSGHLKAGDSLTDAAIGAKEPSTATVAITGLAWKTSQGAIMEDNDTFVQGQTYKLAVTLTASARSQFNAGTNAVTVSAAGVSGTGTATNNNETLTLEIPYTATKMLLSEAIKHHYVTISANAAIANVPYDGASHGPEITMTDVAGGTFDQSSSSAIISGSDVGGTIAGSGTTHTYTVSGSPNAGTYSVDVTVANTEYEGTTTFSLSYTISKKYITPTAIDLSGSRKTYDGTTEATVGGITFDGIVAGQTFVKGTHYDADSFRFDNASASAVGERSIIATDISLKNQELANNYQIHSSKVNLTQTGATIDKATPEPRANSIVFTAVTAAQTQLSSIGFGLNTTASEWFKNIYNPTLNVGGTLKIVDSSTDEELPGNTEITKNTPYRWKFVPTDTTDYTNKYGNVTLWPVAPIKSISFAGITLPTAGAANNITTNAVSGVTVTSIGPSSGCEITVASAEWKEYNPNTNSTSAALSEGYVFKYNRTYTLELTLNASTTDKFATGAGVLAVDFTTGGGNYLHMTSVTVSETQAKFKYSVEIGKGTLTADMFTVPANQSVIYDGQVHYCTIASISAVLDDGYLEYRTATNGAITNATWTSYAGVNANAGLSGYRDASASPQTYQIEIRHPDYTATSPITRTYNIAIGPKAINTISIAAITKKPYDTTTAVNVTLSSVDIIDGDAVALTAGTAMISNPNCTTSSVTVNANGITKTGADSGNYNLVTTTATTSGALNVIQKVTPTGGSITYSAVTIINPKFSNIGVTPQGFKNEYIENAALNDVAGTIISSRNAEFTQTEDNDSSVRKRFEYWWKFVPNDSDNYNEVTGRAVYWPGSPLTIATLTGIALPAPNAVPTAKESINLAINDPTADVTISAIAWYESAPNDAEHAGVTERALSTMDKFYYNRYHTLVITLSAVGTPDEFNADGNSTTPTFAGIIDISGDTYRCTTALQTVSTTDGDKYQIAVITCDFQKTNSSTREITAKGTLTLNNLEFRDFASYLEQNGTTAYSDGLRGEYTGQNAAYSYAYVYTGRWVGPNPKVYGLNVSNADVQSVQVPELAKFTYSLDGGVTFSATPPRYKNKMDPQQIRIKLEHPDYDSVGDVYKDVNFQIGPCTVRPEGIVYTGKGYDGTEEIVGAKLLWYPQSSGYDGVSTQAISEDLIDYTADFIFDGANVAPTKNIRVTNVDATSENFICQIDNLPAKNIAKNPLRNDAFTYTGGMLIRPATVKPKNNTILTKSVGSAVTLSAIYDEYITPVQNDSTSNAAIMVNENNTALTVYGILGFDNDTSTGFLSTASMDAITVVQGQSYTWRFVPNDGTNYAVTTGTQILWPFPPPTPSYGGGGGGGAAPAPTKAAVSTLSGVIATPGSFSTQIHVYLASGGSIVTDKAFFARVTGAAVDRALTAMPDGNVVVDRDGNIIVKAIIEGGMLKAYLTGDNYLTIQRRKVDYIDVPGHWFEPYVDFCSVRDIMNGTGENKFSPNDTLTRAMAATILYRLEGSQTLTASNTRRFADVDDDKWYTDGIAWAGGTGIVNGIGIKNFAPHWDITREQMAVMIYNYCCTMCGAQPVPSGSLDRSIYGDGNKIASWAQDAVAYCTKVGLMKGNDKGDFCPKDTATRAEFATIIERLIEGFLDGNL